MIHAYQSSFAAKLRYKGFPEEDIARYAAPEALAAQRNMQALPNAANAMNSDLIVAGRHAGSRLSETIMGSVSKFLVYDASCDVLVV